MSQTGEGAQCTILCPVLSSPAPNTCAIMHTFSLIPGMLPNRQGSPWIPVDRYGEAERTGRGCYYRAGPAGPPPPPRGGGRLGRGGPVEGGGGGGADGEGTPA